MKNLRMTVQRLIADNEQKVYLIFFIFKQFKYNLFKN